MEPPGSRFLASAVAIFFADFRFSISSFAYSSTAPHSSGGILNPRKRHRAKGGDPSSILFLTTAIRAIPSTPPLVSPLPSRQTTILYFTTAISPSLSLAPSWFSALRGGKESWPELRASETGWAPMHSGTRGIRERWAAHHAFEQHENDRLLNRDDISGGAISPQDAHNAPPGESKNPLGSRVDKAPFFDRPGRVFIGSSQAALSRRGMSVAKHGGSTGISPRRAPSLVSGPLSISIGASFSCPSPSPFPFSFLVFGDVFSALSALCSASACSLVPFSYTLLPHRKN